MPTPRCAALAASGISAAPPDQSLWTVHRAGATNARAARSGLRRRKSSERRRQACPVFPRAPDVGRTWGAWSRGMPGPGSAQGAERWQFTIPDERAGRQGVPRISRRFAPGSRPISQTTLRPLPETPRQHDPIRMTQSPVLSEPRPHHPPVWLASCDHRLAGGPDGGQQWRFRAGNTAAPAAVNGNESAGCYRLENIAQGLGKVTRAATAIAPTNGPQQWAEGEKDRDRRDDRRERPGAQPLVPYQPGEFEQYVQGLVDNRDVVIERWRTPDCRRQSARRWTPSSAPGAAGLCHRRRR